MHFWKKKAKNVQLWAIVSSGFSSKNREIGHKAVLTPQEYEDYFFRKIIKKKMEEKIKKPVGGVCASQDWSQENPLTKRIFF